MSPAPLSHLQEHSHDALVAALKDFLDKWPAAEKAINGAITIAALHGCPYNGPQLNIEALRTAFKQAEATHGA